MKLSDTLTAFMNTPNNKMETVRLPQPNGLVTPRDGAIKAYMDRIAFLNSIDVSERTLEATRRIAQKAAAIRVH